MGIGELLDQIRAHYLDRFREAIGERQADPSIRIIAESPYLSSSGSPVREGEFQLPARGDLFIVQDGQVIESLHIDTQGMLGFEILRFRWENSLEVELSPFQWNWCPLALSPRRAVQELAPIVRWFERWFENDLHPDPPLSGVVHSLSDPEVKGEWSHLDVDLGSAPVDALEELLDACIQAGASSVRLGEGLRTASH